MHSNNIVQNGDPVLRETAAQVEASEFGTPELAKLVKKMSEALALHDDGAALAAPQIGVSKRIFVVSKRIFENPNAEDLVFINPRILSTSKTRKDMEEGCLSVRWLYGEVSRAEKATVEAYDLDGKKFVRHGSGLLAQIFQHEIDHLNGTLFIDKADNLQEIPPEEQERRL